jgi:hypothetical protein
MQYTKVDAFAELDATELCRGHQLAGSVGTDSRRTARAGGARGADHHPRPWHIGIERRCTPEGATASPTPRQWRTQRVVQVGSGLPWNLAQSLFTTLYFWYLKPIRSLAQ